MSLTRLTEIYVRQKYKPRPYAPGEALGRGVVSGAKGRRQNW